MLSATLPEPQSGLWGLGSRRRHCGAWGTALELCKAAEGTSALVREGWEVLGHLHHVSRLGLHGRVLATIFVRTHYGPRSVLDASETSPESGF